MSNDLINIDVVVFIGFLIVNFIVGLYYGRGVKDIVGYALGGRNFSTGALVATIVATWIGGDYLFITLAEVYTSGLHYAIGCLGMVVCLLLNAYVFVPRMGEFLGSMSVAEAMGKMYGKEVRLIAAIAGSIAAAGFIAVQFKVFGEILKNFVDLSGTTPIFIAAAVVTIYSTLGGIKAVAFTDILQFLTFGVLVPVIGVIIWNDCSSVEGFSLHNALSSPIFDYHEFIDPTKQKFWSLLLLFILFAIPDLNPTMFQRVAIGRDIAQVKKAFAISSLILFVILVGMSWIAFLLYSANPNLQPTGLVQYIIDTYSSSGLKIFILIGVIAMCMSTADSNMNSAAVMLSHDFCAPLNLSMKNELLLCKIIALILGVVSVWLALLDYDLLPLVFMTQSFYIPIIDVPLILAILGFRSSTKAVLIGMGASFISVIIWRMYFMDTGVDSIIPGTIVNLVVFVASHYILGTNGNNNGGGTPTSPDYRPKLRENNIISKVTHSVSNFSVMKFCTRNAPRSGLIYTGFGAFGIVLTICTMYTMSNVPAPYKPDYTTLLPLYESMLVFAMLFLTYPIWPQVLKKNEIIHVIWTIGVFYILIFCSGLLSLLSHFDHLQLIILTISIITTAVLIRWQSAVYMGVIGLYLSFLAYEYCTGANGINIDMHTVSFALYSILLSGVAIIAFLKPTQEAQELAWEKVDYLTNKINDYRDELYRATELKYEFLRNLEHEAHTPITGITSMAQAMAFAYDKLPEEKRKQAIEDIATNAERLESYVNNLIDLSKLSSLKYELEIKKTDLSSLINGKVERCKRLYISDQHIDHRKIVTNIEPNIIISCDEYYIARTIENIIVNAIQYCKEGRIEIKLQKNKEGVVFTVKDNGIGIPNEYMKDIFGAFTTSSKTKTPSGGRGIGLALSKKVMDLHHGTITVESDGESWTEVKCII